MTRDFKTLSREQLVAKIHGQSSVIKDLRSKNRSLEGKLGRAKQKVITEKGLMGVRMQLVQVRAEKREEALKAELKEKTDMLKQVKQELLKDVVFQRKLEHAMVEKERAKDELVAATPPPVLPFDFGKRMREYSTLTMAENGTVMKIYDGGPHMFHYVYDCTRLDGVSDSDSSAPDSDSD
ncbi:unnamed protein product [Prorocentrum cordatum]|uniref:Kinetochore protein Spc24 n=1 Tax=Prorocentrum cordatum TaxID=2364126 RepID=A0ABN9SRP0_9DINO|nr:unnamed protein product [Polarella glacialis]